MNLEQEHHDFASNLRKLRMRRGLTVSEVARETGLSVSTIRNAESGTVWPTTYTTSVLCRFFGVTERQLRGLEGWRVFTRERR